MRGKVLTPRQLLALQAIGVRFPVDDMVVHTTDGRGDVLVSLKTGTEYGIKVDLDGFLRGSPYYFIPRC